VPAGFTRDSQLLEAPLASHDCHPRAPAADGERESLETFEPSENGLHQLSPNPKKLLGSNDYTEHREEKATAAAEPRAVQN
jgi:hypothetical protein